MHTSLPRIVAQSICTNDDFKDRFFWNLHLLKKYIGEFLILSSYLLFDKTLQFHQIYIQ